MSAANETRWLDAQEQQVWAQLSTMILRLQPVLSAQLQREFGISQFEYLITGASVGGAGIDAPDERARHDSPAARCRGCPRPSVASKSAVGCHGSLTRRTVGTPLRFCNPAGLRQLQEAAPSHVAAVREFVFDRLTRAQARQLGAICQRILDGLPPDESWPSTPQLLNARWRLAPARALRLRRPSQQPAPSLWCRSRGFAESQIRRLTCSRQGIT